MTGRWQEWYLLRTLVARSYSNNQTIENEKGVVCQHELFG